MLDLAVDAVHTTSQRPGLMDQKFWYLKRCDLFERLSPEQAARLETRARSRKVPRGGLVYLPSDRSDSLLVLAAGRIKIYHLTGDGKQAVLALIEPGEVFGELALFDPGPREEFAEAMEPSTVLLIPGDEVQRLMEEVSTVSLGVTRLLGLRRQRTERRLKSLLFRSNRERLIHLLLDLVERYGRATDEGIALEIRLSHQDLAGMIGSTRETVTVLLGELQAEGSLRIARRRVVLTRMDRLVAETGARTPIMRPNIALPTPVLRGVQAGP